jgi:hypothetical protein
MFVLNFAYWLFLKVKFNLQPFGKAHAYVLGIFAVCLPIGLYLPALTNIYLDMVYRSVVIGMIYSFLTYLFAVSEDINIIFDKVLKRSGKAA